MKKRTTILLTIIFALGFSGCTYDTSPESIVAKSYSSLVKGDFNSFSATLTKEAFKKYAKKSEMYRLQAKLNSYRDVTVKEPKAKYLGTDLNVYKAEVYGKTNCYKTRHQPDYVSLKFGTYDTNLEPAWICKDEAKIFTVEVSCQFEAVVPVSNSRSGYSSGSTKEVCFVSDIQE